MSDKSVLLNYFLIPISLIIGSSQAFSQNIQPKEQTVEMTIESLMNKGYEPLPCNTEACKMHLTKKVNKGYSNVHKIDSTAYFVEVTDQSNIVANKQATTLAKLLATINETNKTILNDIDANGDYIIYIDEIKKYQKEQYHLSDEDCKSF